MMLLFSTSHPQASEAARGAGSEHLSPSSAQAWHREAPG